MFYRHLAIRRGFGLLLSEAQWHIQVLKRDFHCCCFYASWIFNLHINSSQVAKITFCKLKFVEEKKEGRKWSWKKGKKTRQKGESWQGAHVASEKKSELPLGTNIAQQAVCHMSKAFDFHSGHFISLWFRGNKSEVSNQFLLIVKVKKKKGGTVGVGNSTKTIKTFFKLLWKSL